MRFSADTLKYLSWIVTARTPQEANDLIYAALQCTTWTADHAMEVIRKSMGKSNWQRAILVLDVHATEHIQLPPAVYTQLLTALVKKGNREVAWEELFKRMHMHDIPIAAASIQVLQQLAKRDPNRQHILESYLERMKDAGTEQKQAP